MPKAGRDRPIGCVDVIVIISGFIFIFFGAFALAGERPPRGETWQYWMFGISAFLFPAGAYILYRRKFRRDRFRDWFDIWTDAPYESAGVHLVPVVSPERPRPGGPIRYAVFYQNRFNATSTVHVQLAPGPKFIGRYKLPSAAWKLKVGPAEVGVIWKDFTVSPEASPGLMKLEVMARGSQGWGREVRYRPGNVLSNRTKSGLMMAVTLAGGGFFLNRQATITIPVEPDGDETPPCAQPEGSILIWNPDLTDQDGEREMRRALAIAGLEWED